MRTSDATMSPEARDTTFDRMVDAAKELGADEAKVIDVREIVIDKRVRLKCHVPICASFGRNLMCPPNTMSVEEFAGIIGLYRKAQIIQIEADYDSMDKLGECLSKRTYDELERLTNTVDWQVKLHRLVNQLETVAFKEGFYLAAGLIGGDCRLCPECVTPQGNEPCRHPFEARPSMEAMGIDVVKTCENAGLPISLSAERRVRWTGLILLC